jgi:nitrogen fixation protein FixH
MRALLADKAFRDRWLWLVFPLMFLVVASANGVMVYYALSTWPGLAYANASERGRKFNQVLAAEEKESSLGWTFALRLADGRLAVDAKARDGAALTDVALAATLVRPLGGTDDVRVVLLPDGPGRYAASVDLPLKGQWEVRLAAERMGERAHSAQRVLVR